MDCSGHWFHRESVGGEEPNPNALKLFVFGAYNFILIITGNIYR